MRGPRYTVGEPNGGRSLHRVPTVRNIMNAKGRGRSMRRLSLKPSRWLPGAGSEYTSLLLDRDCALPMLRELALCSLQVYD